MIIRDHKSLNASFFRNVNSPELFKEFFTKFGAWDDLKLKEKPKYSEIFSAWNMLDHPRRLEMEEYLSQMNDMADEKGRGWLYTVGSDVNLSGLNDFTVQKLAFRLFLDHPEEFKRAYEYFALEKVENLRVFIGREPVPCNSTESNINQFGERLKSALKSSGHGARLKVEPGPHPPGKWVMVIANEHYAKPDHVFDDSSEIVSKDRRPVYDLILIYYPDKGVLKLKVGRSKKKAEAVASAFSTELLHKRIDHFQITEIISFDPLKRDDFQFQKRPEDSFDWAKPVEIRFRSHDDKTYTHTLHCDDTLDGKQGVLDRLKEMGMSIHNIEIDSLSIQFKYPGGKKKRKTVNLIPPNGYNLDETAKDRELEDVLIRWGFIDIEAKRAQNVAELVEQRV